MAEGAPETSIPGEIIEYVLPVVMRRSDYYMLLQGSVVAGQSPHGFLMDSIAQAAFFAREQNKGSRILIQNRWGGLREFIS